MGTPGKGMLLIAGPGRVMLTATGKTAIVQASGVCCECNCCIATVYACICDTAVTIPVNGAVQTVDVSACCTCVETPVELDVWVTCAEPDPPTLPITYLLTLHWEFRCGDDTPVTGSVSVDDLCDAGTIIENAISVAGCTFGDYYSANVDDLDLCCADGCLTFEYADGSSCASGFQAMEQTGCGTNTGAPADPDDRAGLNAVQIDQCTPDLDICTGEAFQLVADYTMGRNPATTADIIVTLTIPDCVGIEITGAVADNDVDPPVNGVVVWDASGATITFSNTPALDELPIAVYLDFTLTGCCCAADAEVVQVEFFHELDPGIVCVEFAACSAP